MAKRNIKDPRPVVLIDQTYGMPKSGKTLSREVNAYGWRLLNLSSLKGYISDSFDIVGALIQNNIDGPEYKHLRDNNIPIIRIGAGPSFFYNKKKKLPATVIDFEECGHIAANFFAERGFNHLAYISNDPFVNGKCLFENFKSTGTKKGCKVHLHTITRPVEINKKTRKSFFRHSEKSIATWLKSLPKPIGLLCYSDNLAARYLTYCISAGIDVPNDVAILGIGNSGFLCETSIVSISSIDLPWSNLWIEALKMLKKNHDGKKIGLTVKTIPPYYVAERESTEIVALDNPIVKKGIEYIWENYDRNIGVEDLVKTTNTSRRALQINFKNTLGRGVNEEIRLKRLNVAQRLLVNTGMVITEVAKKCGFNSSNYFNKAFVKKYQCTPMEYRNKNKDTVNAD
jgi:LacI family transcriptional regulator